MSEWETKKLGDVIDIKHGYAFKGKFFVDYPTKDLLLTPGNFAIGGGFQNPKPKYYDGPVPEDYVLTEGDCVVTMTDLSKKGDTLGYPAIIPKDDFRYLLNQRIGLITKKKDDVDLLFVYYLMRTYQYQRFVVGSASGATVKHTSPKRICAYETLFPKDSTTQTKIATALHRYESLIENNRKRILLLDETAQRLYTEWFVNFKFPGHESLKMFDSGTKLGKIPEGWNAMKVEDLLERVPSGRKYENKTVEETGKVPVLDQGKSGVIGYHNDEPGVVASTEQPIIVFANHTCYQNLIVYPFSTIQNVLPFLPTGGRDIYWLHWATKDLIKFNDYKGHWPEFISKYCVVPTTDLTREFGMHVSKIVALKYNLEVQNQVLVKMRDLLIPQLVTGKRELKDV